LLGSQARAWSIFYSWPTVLVVGVLESNDLRRLLAWPAEIVVP
jgi:hypothetical protein